jgi:hypothetical protein
MGCVVFRAAASGIAMNDQNERFAIVPVEGKSPPEAIVVGPMSEVTSYIGQSIARIEEEQRLAQAQRDAEETKRYQAEVRECAAQILADGITRLNERIDAYEGRKQERADQLQRQAEEAEAARIEEELAALPDPDDPYSMGDDGELTAVHEPVDTEKHDPERRNEAVTGAMPKELDKGAPPQPGDYLSTTPPPPKYRDPVAIGGP